MLDECACGVKYLRTLLMHGNITYLGLKTEAHGPVVRTPFSLNGG